MGQTLTRKLRLTRALGGAIAACAFVMTLAAPASAAPKAASSTVRVERGVVEVTDRDLASPEAVEQLLLRIEKVQGSTSLAFVDTAPEKVRAAILATITRPAPDDVVESHGTYGPAETAQLLAQLGVLTEGGDGVQLYGWTCGWGYKKVSYTPGAITYYWFSLKTSFCWDGSTIQYPPIQEVLGDGSWGWSYVGCANCYVTGWPAPTAYKSFAQGHMNLGAGVDYDRWPWIQHIVDGTGWVYTSWHD
jgi:hypothetical protein